MQRNVLFWLAVAAVFLVALSVLSPVLLPFVAGLVIGAVVVGVLHLLPRRTQRAH